MRKNGKFAENVTKRSNAQVFCKHFASVYILLNASLLLILMHHFEAFNFLNYRKSPPLFSGTEPAQ